MWEAEALNDETLYEALAVACNKRTKDQWLNEIIEEHGMVVTDWTQNSMFIGKSGVMNKIGLTSVVKRERADSDDEAQGPIISERAKRLRSGLRPGLSFSSGEDEDPEFGPTNMRRTGAEIITRAFNYHWTPEEDAILISLRERELADAEWEDVIAAFYKRFGNRDRSHSSIMSQYLNRLHPSASMKGAAPAPTCARRRAMALSLLDGGPVSKTSKDIADHPKPSSESMQQGFDPDDSNNKGQDFAAPKTPHSWTIDKDAELIRLNESGKVQDKRVIRKLFRDKFPKDKHSAKAIRHRYKYYLQANAHSRYGRFSKEVSDTARVMALSVLDSSTSSSGKRKSGDQQADSPSGRGRRWTGEEDACLVWLREDKKEESWEKTEFFFRRANPGTMRTRARMRLRYHNYLQLNAWLEGSSMDTDKETCDEMRARALSLIPNLVTRFDTAVREHNGPFKSNPKALKPSGGTSASHSQSSKASSDTGEIPMHPDFEPGSNKKWTTEEDAHLIQIREKRMPNSTWDQQYQAWKEVLPLAPRTASALRTRYKTMLAPGASGKDGLDERECQEVRDRALAFIMEVGENKACKALQDSTGLTHTWSVKEDAMVLRLREHVFGKAEWTKIAQKFKKLVPGSSRTSGAIAKRYGEYLDSSLSATPGRAKYRANAQAYLTNLDSDSEAEESSGAEEIGRGTSSGQQYTTAEDAEIIRLKERVPYDLGWDAVLPAFKQKFPRRQRSASGLKDRYLRYLAPNAPGRSEDIEVGRALRLRKDAITYLDQAAPQNNRAGQVSTKRARANVISLLSGDDETSTDGSDADDSGSEDESDEEDDSDTCEEDDDHKMVSSTKK